MTGLPPTIISVQATTHSDGTHAVWMKDHNARLHIFSPREARALAAALNAEADKLEPKEYTP